MRPVTASRALCHHSADDWFHLRTNKLEPTSELEWAEDDETVRNERIRESDMRVG